MSVRNEEVVQNIKPTMMPYMVAPLNAASYGSSRVVLVSINKKVGFKILQARKCLVSVAPKNTFPIL